MAKSYYQHRADCIWFFRNTIRFLRNNLKFRFLQDKDLNVLFFVIDPKKDHPGMVDRFKGIVNAYYFAKQNNYAFKIIYKTPFPLENYLHPNNINWVADWCDLKYSIFQTRFINECDWHKLPKLRKNRQYHIYNYVGNGIAPFVPAGESQRIWRELFNDLFVPTRVLSDVIESNILHIGFPFVAIHIRFVNTLDSFETSHSFTGCNTLTPCQQSDLIERCKSGIMRIIQDNGNAHHYLVLSDSKRFLNDIKELPVITLPTDKIAHTSFTTDEATILKTFLDFFLLSRADVVYRIMAPELYSSSCYALYASIVGNVPFKTVNV